MELVLLRVVIVPADDGIEVVRLPVPDLRLLLERRPVAALAIRVALVVAIGDDVELALVPTRRQHAALEQPRLVRRRAHAVSARRGR